MSPTTSGAQRLSEKGLRRLRALKNHPAKLDDNVGWDHPVFFWFSDNVGWNNRRFFERQRMSVGFVLSCSGGGGRRKVLGGSFGAAEGVGGGWAVLLERQRVSEGVELCVVLLVLRMVAFVVWLGAVVRWAVILTWWALWII